MTTEASRVAALMAKCSCGHLVMHGWHLKGGCQFDDCACQLGAGGALLASDWLAAHDAQVRADERQKVEALLADESTVETVAEEVWAKSASPGAAPTDAHRDISRAVLGALAGLIGEEREKE